MTLEDFPNLKYRRIKPRINLIKDDHVLARNKNTDRWLATIFIQRRDNGNKKSYRTWMGDFKQCILFKGNEHLEGKKDGGQLYELQIRWSAMNYEKGQQVLVRDKCDAPWRAAVYVASAPGRMRHKTDIGTFYYCLDYHEELEGTCFSPEQLFG